jgi:hypothetical protein
MAQRFILIHFCVSCCPDENCFGARLMQRAPGGKISPCKSCRVVIVVFSLKVALTAQNTAQHVPLSSLGFN